MRVIDPPSYPKIWKKRKFYVRCVRCGWKEKAKKQGCVIWITRECCPKCGSSDLEIVEKERIDLVKTAVESFLGRLKDRLI